MRLLLVLLVAGCSHTALPSPEREMPDQSRVDRSGPGLLVDDYICDKACEYRKANGITLISP